MRKFYQTYFIYIGKNVEFHSNLDYNPIERNSIEFICILPNCLPVSGNISNILGG